MMKSRDGKFPILPSTTRICTVLNTSAALDSPSVISKLVTPPPHTHATHTATTAKSETASDTHDVTYTVLMMLLILCLISNTSRKQTLEKRYTRTSSFTWETTFLALKGVVKDFTG